MSGRELYERFCDLRLRVPDWWRLTNADRDAWDRLAAEIGATR